MAYRTADQLTCSLLKHWWFRLRAWVGQNPWLDDDNDGDQLINWLSTKIKHLRDKERNHFSRSIAIRLLMWHVLLVYFVECTHLELICAKLVPSSSCLISSRRLVAGAKPYVPQLPPMWRARWRNWQRPPRLPRSSPLWYITGQSFCVSSFPYSPGLRRNKTWTLDTKFWINRRTASEAPSNNLRQHLDIQAADASDQSSVRTSPWINILSWVSRQK